MQGRQPRASAVTKSQRPGADTGGVRRWRSRRRWRRRSKEKTEPSPGGEE